MSMHTHTHTKTCIHTCTYHVYTLETRKKEDILLEDIVDVDGHVIFNLEWLLSNLKIHLTLGEWTQSLTSVYCWRIGFWRTSVKRSYIWIWVTTLAIREKEKIQRVCCLSRLKISWLDAEWRHVTPFPISFVFVCMPRRLNMCFYFLFLSHYTDS